MTMHNVNPFTQQDGAEVRQECQVVGQSGRRCDGYEWNMVNLDARNKPANTNAVWRVRVRDDDDLLMRVSHRHDTHERPNLMASPEKVRAEHIHVAFDTTDIGVEEVPDNAKRRIAPVNKLLEPRNQVYHARNAFDHLLDHASLD